MIKYKTTGYYGTPTPKIEKVEVERETDASVWIKGKRYSKVSEYNNFFNTWGEAHGFILLQADDKVASARLALNGYQGLLGNIKGLKEV